MKQKGVTLGAISFVKTGCKEILDKLNIRVEAVANVKGKIKGLSISGRTLSKIFIGEYVHPNTIKKVIEQDLNKKTCLINGKIEVVDATDNTSTYRPADGEAIS